MLIVTFVLGEYLAAFVVRLSISWPSVLPYCQVEVELAIS